MSADRLGIISIPAKRGKLMESRLGVISIPAETISDLLGIGTDVRSRLVHVFSWEQEMACQACTESDLEDVKKSIPIGKFRVISQEFHFDSQTFRFLVQSTYLAPVSPGALIPALEVECRTSNRENPSEPADVKYHHFQNHRQG